MRTPQIKTTLDPKARRWLEQKAAELDTSVSAMASQIIENAYYGESYATAGERLEMLLGQADQLLDRLDTASSHVSEDEGQIRKTDQVHPSELRAFMLEMLLLMGRIIKDETVKSDVAARVRQRYGDEFVMKGR